MSVTADIRGRTTAIPSVEGAMGVINRRLRITLGVLAAILMYLVYAFVALDVPGLIASARPERAILLGTDSVAYKVHVEKDLRRGGLEISVEGERRATYETPPDWVVVEASDALIDLTDGYRVSIDGGIARFDVPDFGMLDVVAHDDGVTTYLPNGMVVAEVLQGGVQTSLPDGTVIEHLDDDLFRVIAPDGTVSEPPDNTQLDALIPAAFLPDWIDVDPRKTEARPTIGRRLQVTRSRIEVHRYFFGWEDFWYDFDHPLNGRSFVELVALSGSDQRIDPRQSNLSLVFDGFWNNQGWQHGHVFVALLETILMGVLGTITAVFVGLPLAFIAARNFTPSLVALFVIRRIFDFLRGVDALIWSLIFIRAFGLGPLTGALAIAFTDTGTLGKLFSEALENIDNRQLEGVRATGAGRLARYRYGVIPQLMPVFISQGLYYLESNMRSATVIGALGAGGIGLVLVETLRTSRDWENTLYIILLTLIMVVVMDNISTTLRRRLIRGREAR